MLRPEREAGLDGGGFRSMCSAWETFDWAVVVFAAVMLFAMVAF